LWTKFIFESKKWDILSSEKKLVKSKKVNTHHDLESRILVTGSAGFIGYHLCQSLLDDGYTVHGVDNINSYYDPTLKQARLRQLQSHPNFSFNKLDISNSDELNKAFEDFKPHKVVNLAAQAGVRYSLENPQAYIPVPQYMVVMRKFHFLLMIVLIAPYQFMQPLKYQMN
jgi:NAD(P)-dependent dehydrogenase (short-subunit alcohol dehydrogenase family)